MRLLLIVIFVTLVAQFSCEHTFTIDFHRPRDFWERHFAHLFKNEQVIKAEHFLERLKEYAREAFKRDVEKKMVDEISHDFLHRHAHKVEHFSEDVVREHLDHFDSFARQRANVIYRELLELYELDKESEEVLEMIFKEPEYYGLTYESWKIMTFAKDLEKDLGRGSDL